TPPSHLLKTDEALRRARRRVYRGVAMGAGGAALLALGGLVLPRLAGRVLSRDSDSSGAGAATGSPAGLVGVLSTRADADAGSPSALPLADPMPPSAPVQAIPDPKPVVSPPLKISHSVAAAARGANPAKAPVALATRVDPVATPAPAATTSAAP